MHEHEVPYVCLISGIHSIVVEESSVM